MGAYNESLIKAGVLLAGEGLADAKEGFVVDFDATPPVVTDGPYAEAKELFNGFWIIGVSSKEEAAEWAKRCPLGPGVEARGAPDQRARGLPAGQRVDPEGSPVARGAPGQGRRARRAECPHDGCLGRGRAGG